MGNTLTDPFIGKKKIAPYSAGPLSGLTFAVKDNIDLAGDITGYGSPAWAAAHSKAAANAVCVEQLLASGAECVGKTKSDELAYSLLGVNPFYGTPLNPAAPDRVPGGSSSGSASAVASGLADFALGTDTGGSIRVPAANCGVWGYRPSHGAISLSGVLNLAPSHDTVGVLARDGGVLLKAADALLCGGDSSDYPVKSICVVEDLFKMCSGGIKDALSPAIGKLGRVCAVRSVTLSEISGCNADCSVLFGELGYLLSLEVWNTFGAWIEHDAPPLSDGVRHNLANYAAALDRKEAQRHIAFAAGFRRNLNSFLADGEMLCFPTVVDPAPRLDELSPEFYAGDYVPRAMGVNAVSCLSGAPQISVPAAKAGGVPVGLSFLAARGRDMSLARFCAALPLG